MIKKNIIQPSETPCCACSKDPAITLDKQNKPVCSKCLKNKEKEILSQLGSSPDLIKRHSSE